MTVYSLVTKRGCGSLQRVRQSTDKQSLVVTGLQHWGAGGGRDSQWLWWVGA